MTDFSLSLDEDQIQLQKWVHDFAEGVIRPAAHEWDEREEFPWPVVQEAAQIGLYGVDFLLNAMADPTGLTLPVAIEEMFWGDAGIGMAIMGSGLAAAGIAGNGTPEQVMEWVPQCYGTADNVQLGAFCVSEPDAGSDVSSLRTRAVYDEANDEWTITAPRRGSPTAVSPTSTWWSPRSTRRSDRRGRPASSCRRRPPVSPRARSTSSTESVRATPPKWCSTT